MRRGWGIRRFAILRVKRGSGCPLLSIGTSPGCIGILRIVFGSYRNRFWMLTIAFGDRTYASGCSESLSAVPENGSGCSESLLQIGHRASVCSELLSGIGQGSSECPDSLRPIGRRPAESPRPPRPIRRPLSVNPKTHHHHARRTLQIRRKSNRSRHPQ